MTDALGFYDFTKHPKQLEFMRLAERDVGEAINIFHGVAGRGSGKTIALIAMLFDSCVRINRGHPHILTAPTYAMIDRFLIPT